MSAMKTMAAPQSSLLSTIMKPSVRSNWMIKQNKFSNGPKRKELSITRFCASQDQVVFLKNNKLSSTWIIFSSTVQ
jgi:hypothetical protein